MSDELLISGGGSWRITTEGMETAETLALRASADIDGLVRRLALIETARPAGLQSSMLHSSSTIGDVTARVGGILQQESELLIVAADGVGSSADRYAAAEFMTAAAFDGIGSFLLSRTVDLVLLGLAGSALWASLLAFRFPGAPVVLGTLGTIGLSGALRQGRARGGSSGVPHLAPSAAVTKRAQAILTGMLTDPEGVRLLRALVDNLDDEARTRLGIPPGLSWLFDDEATGALGRGEASLVAALLLGRTVLPDGPVSIARVPSPAGAPPTQRPASIGDMSERVPDGTAEEGLIRIERWVGADGTPQAVVYLGGTNGSPDQPFDVAANLSADAGLESGAMRAVRLAMIEAGVAPGDSVSFVGYSQGALVATKLAATGDWSVTGMVTVGSPVSAAELPSSIPVLNLAHAEDPITALSAPRYSDAPPAAVTASRVVLDGRVGDSPLAGHDLDLYRETAALVDQDDTERIRAVRAEILAVSSGSGPVTTSVFSASRVVELADPPRVSADVPRAASGGHR